MPEIHNQLAVYLIALILGLAVGSFLNVLALRSLSGESMVWPGSQCPKCKHRLSVLDNIPILSYFILLKGKCRYCAAPISWQYPAVEAFTAITFVALTRIFLFGPALLSQQMAGALFEPLSSFQPPWHLHNAYVPFGYGLSFETEQFVHVSMLIGAIIFACTLIAVTVTDFREKLIPHEITYPSMLIGIAFSAIVRRDLLGAMAGIGASYILFDFMAFYGLKAYMYMHQAAGEEEGEKACDLDSGTNLPAVDESVDCSFNLAEEQTLEAEPLEVMGGGDAVLAAVMSAYLGWQLLAIALIIGFLIGTAMGLILLIVEMQKAKLLHKCRLAMLKWAAILAAAFGTFGIMLALWIPRLAGTDLDAATIFPVAGTMSVVGIVSGLVLAIVSVGTKVSKPYPFAPALAAGGFVALFLLPNWHNLFQ